MIEHGPSELDARPQSRREWSGWLRSLVLPLGLLVAIVAGLLYLQSSRGGSNADGAFGTVALPAARNVTGKAPDASIGRAAPDFLLPALDGSQVRLSDLQGHPVLLNFWASWCISCRAETPQLVDAALSGGNQGVMIVGVDLREADSIAGDFANEFGIPYPILLDRSGQVARTWRIGGPTEGLPSSYFIDSAGVVQKVVYGELTAQTLADGLKLIDGAN